MKYILLSLLVFLGGCRFYSMADHKQDVLAQYYGATSEQVVLGYGLPTKTTTVGSMYVMVYEKRETRYVPETYDIQTDREYDRDDHRHDKHRDRYNTTNTRVQKSGGYYEDYWCKTNFFLKGGRVFDVNFDGNNCYEARIIWE